MFAPFHYAFVQRGAFEVLLLSVAAGLLGTWIVLRGLAFYSHAVGTAAFPGLVAADGLALPAPLGAGVAAAAFGLGVERLVPGNPNSSDSRTAPLPLGAPPPRGIPPRDGFPSPADVRPPPFAP